MNTDNINTSPCVPFDEGLYREMVDGLFVRFPSVQNAPFSQGYKPGLGRMLAFDEFLGHPWASYPTIHVAGTNGKGSTSAMLASILKSCGLRVGLYTSPHICDFRERMLVDGEMVPREWVFSFLRREGVSRFMDGEDLSFFEITTGMAFTYFRDAGVDVAVIETGLGGRLDSTNIITPVLSVITSIALDHTAYLGNTLSSIAFEKAGIIKPGIPSVVGRVPREAWDVIRAKAEESGSAIVRAEEGMVPPQSVSALWDERRTILEGMDLRGAYQALNLETVLLSVARLREGAMGDLAPLRDDDLVIRGIRTASRSMHLRARWEKVDCRGVDCILDIGHNPEALGGNFDQLRRYLREGTYDFVCIVYAVMADKDLPSIIPLMPAGGEFCYVFTTPSTPRALPSEKILSEVISRRAELASLCNLRVSGSLREALAIAMDCVHTRAPSPCRPLIYVGGSTFAVADAIPVLQEDSHCPMR